MFSSIFHPHRRCDELIEHYRVRLQDAELEQDRLRDQVIALTNPEAMRELTLARNAARSTQPTPEPLGAIQRRKAVASRFPGSPGRAASPGSRPILTPSPPRPVAVGEDERRPEPSGSQHLDPALLNDNE